MKKIDQLILAVGGSNVAARTICRRLYVEMPEIDPVWVLEQFRDLGVTEHKVVGVFRACGEDVRVVAAICHAALRQENGLQPHDLHALAGEYKKNPEVASLMQRSCVCRLPRPSVLTL